METTCLFITTTEHNTEAMSGKPWSSKKIQHGLHLPVKNNWRCPALLCLEPLQLSARIYVLFYISAFCFGHSFACRFLRPVQLVTSHYVSLLYPSHSCIFPQYYAISELLSTQTTARAGDFQTWWMHVVTEHFVSSLVNLWGWLHLSVFLTHYLHAFV